MSIMDKLRDLPRLPGSAETPGGGLQATMIAGVVRTVLAKLGVKHTPEQLIAEGQRIAAAALGELQTLSQRLSNIEGALEELRGGAELDRMRLQVLTEAVRQSNAEASLIVSDFEAGIALARANGETRA